MDPYYPDNPGVHMANEPPPGYYEVEEPAQEWQSPPEHLYTPEPVQTIYEEPWPYENRGYDVGDIEINDEWDDGDGDGDEEDEGEEVWIPYGPKVPQPQGGNTQQVIIGGLPGSLPPGLFPPPEELNSRWNELHTGATPVNRSWRDLSLPGGPGLAGDAKGELAAKGAVLKHVDLSGLGLALLLLLLVLFGLNMGWNKEASASAGGTAGGGGEGRPAKGDPRDQGSSSRRPKGNGTEPGGEASAEAAGDSTSSRRTRKTPGEGGAAGDDPSRTGRGERPKTERNERSGDPSRRRAGDGTSQEGATEGSAGDGDRKNRKDRTMGRDRPDGSSPANGGEAPQGERSSRKREGQPGQEGRGRTPDDPTRTSRSNGGDGGGSNPARPERPKKDTKGTPASGDPSNAGSGQQGSRRERSEEGQSGRDRRTGRGGDAPAGETPATRESSKNKGRTGTEATSEQSDQTSRRDRGDRNGRSAGDEAGSGRPGTDPGATPGGSGRRRGGEGDPSRNGRTSRNQTGTEGTPGQTPADGSTPPSRRNRGGDSRTPGSGQGDGATTTPPSGDQSERERQRREREERKRKEREARANQRQGTETPSGGDAPSVDSNGKPRRGRETRNPSETPTPPPDGTGAPGRRTRQTRERGDEAQTGDPPADTTQPRRPGRDPRRPGSDPGRPSRDPGSRSTTEENTSFLTPTKVLVGLLVLIPLLSLLSGGGVSRYHSGGGIRLPPRSSSRVGMSSRWVASEPPPPPPPPPIPHNVINNVHAQGSDMPIHINTGPAAVPLAPVRETIVEEPVRPLEFHLSGPYDPDRLFGMLIVAALVGLPLFIDWTRDWPRRQSFETEYLSDAIHYLILGGFGIVCLWLFNQQYGYLARMRPTAVYIQEGLRTHLSGGIVATAQGAENLVWAAEDAIFGDGRDLLGILVAGLGVVFLSQCGAPDASAGSTQYAEPALQLLYLLGLAVFALLFANA